MENTDAPRCGCVFSLDKRFEHIEASIRTGRISTFRDLKCQVIDTILNF